jgi:hypothetical protein
MPTSFSFEQDYDELIHELTAILSQVDPIAQERTRLFVDRLTQPGSFGRLLELLLKSKGIVEQIARHSYRHPLGFDKFVLAPLRPLGQLRLHVWWPEDEREREHVHNHRFGFISGVLVGQVQTSVYKPCDGNDLTHFSEVGGTREWKFENLGCGSVSLSINASLAAGSVYSMPADALHRIDATRQLTATLFLESAAHRGSSSIYLTGTQEPAAYRCEALHPDDARRRLSQLLDFM